MQAYTEEWAYKNILTLKSQYKWNYNRLESSRNQNVHVEIY